MSNKGGEIRSRNSSLQRRKPGSWTGKIGSYLPSAVPRPVSLFSSFLLFLPRCLVEWRSALVGLGTFPNFLTHLLFFERAFFAFGPVLISLMREEKMRGPSGMRRLGNFWRIVTMTRAMQARNWKCHAGVFLTRHIHMFSQVTYLHGLREADTSIFPRPRLPLSFSRTVLPLLNIHQVSHSPHRSRLYALHITSPCHCLTTYSSPRARQPGKEPRYLN